MVEGRFARFEHDHFFESDDGGTKMRDVIEFESPFGPMGRFVDWALVTRYLGRLIQVRNETIRFEAESTS